ncbi:MAG: hypothetical protein PHX51_07155 [Clostridia bacterium]|nr:hypothetical protein [Clostridia bacterium]
MKTLNKNIEILSVNFFSTISLVTAWLNSLTGVLTCLVLLSSIIYNGIKIYQALNKKRGDIKNVNK